MSTKVTTATGHALPPGSRHAITLHVPTWSKLSQWIEGDPLLIASFKSGYPRIMIHRDIRTLAVQVSEALKLPKDRTCFLFSRPEPAEAFRAWATSEARGSERLSDSEISIRAFQSKVILFAAFFPEVRLRAVKPFWVFTGIGISSRLAEACLQHLVSPTAIQPAAAPELAESSGHVLIQDRISVLMERAPVGPRRTTAVTREDVFLYPNGMAAIYGLHTTICKQLQGSTILLDFLFHSTLDLFENIGNGCRLLGRGDHHDLEALVADIQHRAAMGLPSIQAVWTEFPTNPLLTSANLKGLRQLADKHNFLLVVDDTVSGFANVDVLSAADVVVSSLAKSFSGYADVMGGSVVLNPSSQRYSELKAMMQSSYHNDYCSQDAAVLERNSRDFVERSHKLNENAKYLAEYLQTFVDDKTSCLTNVLYPTTNHDRKDYEAFMRPNTAEFMSGYGCLFSLGFATTEKASIFYDNLAVHNGPHLGAHLTIALPYTKALYSKQLDWASKHGVEESLIRISVGLEERDDLRERFRTALVAADAAPSPVARISA